MHGPHLTPDEAVASVALRVRRYEAQGLDPELAIRRTSIELSIDPDKVRWCAQRALHRSPPSRSAPGTWRSRALAIAAAL
jgi:hypothetical protein